MKILQFHVDGPAPAGIYLRTEDFAYSKGKPLGTQSLMNCIGVIVHDPVAKQGCLGHLTPERSTEQSQIFTYLEWCIELMDLSQEQRQFVQVVVMGGLSRDEGFVEAFEAALAESHLLLENCLDVRVLLGDMKDGPYLGKRADTFGARLGIYSPKDEATWIDGTGMGINMSTYDHQTQTEKTLDERVGLYYVTSVGLNHIVDPIPGHPDQCRCCSCTIL